MVHQTQNYQKRNYEREYNMYGENIKVTNLKGLVQKLKHDIYGFCSGGAGILFGICKRKI